MSSIQVCKFQKKFTSTYLKVTIASNLRLTGCNKCCKRWFVTFNGAECSPVPIDAVEYIDSPNGVAMNLLRSRTITGTCRITKNGTIIIGFNIGNCKMYGDSDGATGWNSATRIFVEEVNPPEGYSRHVQT